MGEIKIKRVNHVAYPISDRKKSLPFYRDVLGLDVIPSMVDNPNVIWTKVNENSMFHAIEPPEPGRTAGFHVAFEVEDFDAAFEKFRELGYEIQNHGERHDGQKFLFVLDPDGNRVEITSASNLKPSNRMTDEWGYTHEGGG